jgi:hypothetical protein
VFASVGVTVRFDSVVLFSYFILWEKAQVLTPHPNANMGRCHQCHGQMEIVQQTKSTILTIFNWLTVNPTIISKFMKHLSFFSLLVLVACTTTSSPLRENEKNLVGNWMEPVNNGQVRGFYMEFHEDRTGFFGPVININHKVGMAPYMSLLMKDWRIQNDTLSIQFKIRSGLVARGPDGKVIEQSDKPNYAQYVVWEVSDTVIVLEDLIGEFPVKDRLKKSEKIETIELR